MLPAMNLERYDLPIEHAVQRLSFPRQLRLSTFAGNGFLTGNINIFETIDEVQQIATEWLWSYNHERPNTGNGGMPPAQKLRMAA